MKHLLHLSLLSGLSMATIHQVQAQFEALPVGEAVWVEAFWIGPGNPHMGFSYGYDSAAPDTVVNGIAYERIEAGGVFGIRDNGSGQVFFIEEDATEERLLYDFDVEVGDTVRFDASGGTWIGDSVEVISVDTVVMAGVERKRIGVSYAFGEEFPGPCAEWIQGIGSTVGLFHPCQELSVSGITWLVCMSLNGIAQYGSSEGQAANCLIHLDVQDAGTNEALRVWPNPGNDQLNIEGLGSTTSMLRVRNALGALVGEWPTNSTSLRIHTEQWPSGLYLLEGLDDGARVFRTAWVRQ